MIKLDKTVPLIITVLMVSVLTSAAWVAWQSESLAHRIDAGQFEVSLTQDIQDLPRIGYAPLKALLTRGVSQASVDHQLMMELASLYSQRRPLDPKGWLWGSLFLQRAGDLQGAQRYLYSAEQLSSRTASTLTKVFNRYLELGMVESAMPVARTLVESHPARFRRIFYLLTRLNSDYESVVKTVIPTASPSSNRFTKDYYYRFALTDAIRAENSALARAVWDRTPDEMRRSSQHGLRYLNLLASEQNFEQLAKAWFDYTGRELVLNEVFESSFSGELADFSPCWWNGAPDGDAAKWSIDGARGSDQKSLLLEFTGEDNVQFSHLRCIVAVEPGLDYRFAGRWRGKDITTLSGPFVDMITPGVQSIYRRSEALIGSWPWQEFELKFTVPDNVKLVQFRIRRAKK